jgi:hypothetical protein
VGLLRNPDEIAFRFHWAGIQQGRQGSGFKDETKAKNEVQFVKARIYEVSDDRASGNPIWL